MIHHYDDMDDQTWYTVATWHENGVCTDEEQFGGDAVERHLDDMFDKYGTLLHANVVDPDGYPVMEIDSHWLEI